jgi:predicted anti-sigma-YlaC factor YlaD
MTDDHSVDELRCVEVVELLTAYLDGAPADETRKQVDEHLRDCEGCRAALAQWRTVTELAGRLTPADVASLDPYVRNRLMMTVRSPRRR